MPRRGRRVCDEDDEEEDGGAVPLPSVDISDFLEDSDHDQYPPQEMMIDTPPESEEEDFPPEEESESENYSDSEEEEEEEEEERRPTVAATHVRLPTSLRADASLEIAAEGAIAAYRMDEDGRLDLLVRYLGVPRTDLIKILGWSPGSGPLRTSYPTKVRRMHRNLKREVADVLRDAEVPWISEAPPFPLDIKETLRDRALDSLYKPVDVVELSHLILDRVEAAYTLVAKGRLKEARRESLRAFQLGVAVFTKAAADTRVMPAEALAIRYKIPQKRRIVTFVWEGLAWMLARPIGPDHEESVSALYDRANGVFLHRARTEAGWAAIDPFRAWDLHGLDRTWFFAKTEPVDPGYVFYASQMRDFYARIMKRPSFVEPLADRRFARTLLAGEMRDFSFIIHGRTPTRVWQFSKDLFGDVDAFFRRFITTFGIIPPYLLLERMRQIVHDVEGQWISNASDPEPAAEAMPAVMVVAPAPAPISDYAPRTASPKRPRIPKAMRRALLERFEEEEDDMSATLDDLLDIARDDDDDDIMPYGDRRVHGV